MGLAVWHLCKTLATSESHERGTTTLALCIAAIQLLESAPWFRIRTVSGAVFKKALRPTTNRAKQAPKQQGTWSHLTGVGSGAAARKWFVLPCLVPTWERELEGLVK